MKFQYFIFLIILFSFQNIFAQISERERGINLYEQKKYTEAVQSLTAAIREDESDVISFYYLGQSLEKLNKTQEAIQSYTSSYQKGLLILEKTFGESVLGKPTPVNGKHTEYVINKIGSKVEAALKSAERLEPLVSRFTINSELNNASLIFNYFLKETKPNSGLLDSPKNLENRKLNITKQPAPLYNRQAKKNETTGKINVYVMFLANGKIGLVFPRNELPDGLTQAIVDAAKKLEFVPELRNGEPITVIKTVVYIFSTY